VQDQKQQQRAKLEEMQARQQQQKQKKQPAARSQQNSVSPELPGTAAPIRRANDGFSFTQQ
jgi:hypothetical protein